MALATSRIPIIKTASPALSTAGTLDFSASGVMGSCYIRNRGAGIAYIKFDGSVASAAVADGQIGLAQNQSLNLDDIAFTSIGFRMDASGAGILEAVALPRPGSSGAGQG